MRGATELPEQVWGNPSPGFKHSVACPYCTVSPRYRWDLNVRESDLSAAILKGLEKRALPLGWYANARDMVRSGKLVDLWVKRRDERQRVSEVCMIWRYRDHLYELPLTGVLLREWLGATRLRSTRFQIQPLAGRKEWKFAGQGNGHGVGMCQWGAKVMGEKGYRTAAILKYYYPDASLRKVEDIPRQL